MATETCRISWLGPEGQPTPDGSDAIGTARVVHTYTDGRTWISKWYPICQNHLGVMPVGRMTYATGRFGDLESAEWEFVPYLDLETTRPG